LLLDHVTVRPDKGYPSASSGVAVSGHTLTPISKLTSAGLTKTDATGAWATVTTAVSAAAVCEVPCAMTLKVPRF